MRLVLTTIIIMIVAASACSKTEVVDEPGTGNTVISVTEQKIRQNWTFDHSVLNDYGVNPGSDTIHGQTGDYYIFHTNNKAYSFWNNTYDTVSYQVLGSSSMLYGGDTMVITTLNSVQFVFKKVVQTGTTHYENVLSLSK